MTVALLLRLIAGSSSTTSSAPPPDPWNPNELIVRHNILINNRRLAVIGQQILSGFSDHPPHTLRIFASEPTSILTTSEYLYMALVDGVLTLCLKTEMNFFTSFVPSPRKGFVFRNCPVFESGSHLVDREGIRIDFDESPHGEQSTFIVSHSSHSEAAIVGVNPLQTSFDPSLQFTHHRTSFVVWSEDHKIPLSLNSDTLADLPSTTPLFSTNEHPLLRVIFKCKISPIICGNCVITALKNGTVEAVNVETMQKVALWSGNKIITDLTAVSDHTLRIVLAGKKKLELSLPTPTPVTTG